MYDSGDSPPDAPWAAPWSGGRPWVGADRDLNPPPDQRLRGTGACLARALALVAGEMLGDAGEVLGGGGEATAGASSQERRCARLVDLAVAAERVKAWAGGLQARAAAALHAELHAELMDDLASGPSPDRRHCLSEEIERFGAAGRAAGQCLSLALGMSGRASDRLLALGLSLRELPDLGRALAQGQVHLAQAQLVCETAGALTVEQRTVLVDSVVSDPAGPHAQRLLPELRDGQAPVWSVPPHELRPLLNRRVAELAPAAVQEAERIARRERRVEHYASTPERPGALVLHGPDHLLSAAYGAVDRAARTARRAGAAETLDQLRFDGAMAAMTGVPADPAARARATARRPPANVTVDVVVPATMLLGLDELDAGPAFLRTASGDVPLSPDLARALAHDECATWRRILCDPTSGIAVDVSRRYRPPRDMTQFCAVRDGHASRHPTSGARALELDHVEEFDLADPGKGGPTTPGNLACVGKRDHQAKTDRLIDVAGDANLALTYRTLAGHAYRSWPHRYLNPGPGPPGAGRS